MRAQMVVFIAMTSFAGFLLAADFGDVMFPERLGEAEYENDVKELTSGGFLGNIKFPELINSDLSEAMQKIEKEINQEIKKELKTGKKPDEIISNLEEKIYFVDKQKINKLLKRKLEQAFENEIIKVKKIRAF